MVLFHKHGNIIDQLDDSTSLVYELLLPVCNCTSSLVLPSGLHVNSAASKSSAHASNK